MLQINNLQFKFPKEDVYLLDNISIELEGGDILCIEGQNGSGKTTLLKLISGFFDTNTYQGSIKFHKNLVQIFIPSDLNHFLLPWYTFGENISFFNTLGKSLKCKQSIDKGFDILANFDINNSIDIKNRKVYKLSSGEKAYLGLTCALLKNPDILVLDEIFSNIHYNTSEKIVDYLQQKFINSETAIIFTSHNPDIVKSFFSKKFQISRNENSIKT